MKFLVVTLAPTLSIDNSYYSYAPYVKEMDLWFSQVNDVVIVSPTTYSKKLLTAPFLREDINVVSIPSLSFNSVENVFKSLVSAPVIFYKMLSAMNKADHIHLRCPGNIALLGCLTQIFFPKKTKTAKYAGNWDPKSKQPLSYRFQKWILSNTFLTKNMQVLVYGNWPKQTHNIKPFFTASYPKAKIDQNISKNFLQPLRFLFVGNLSAGKQPLMAIKLMEGLLKKDIKCTMDLYGDGIERINLESYIKQNSLEEYVFVHGNMPSELLEKAYKTSDFLMLPSKSEGWPKVVAEAMWWGVVPIVSSISCVPWMLGNGERGILLDGNFEIDLKNLLKELANKEALQNKSIKAQQWSHQYSLDDFEAEINKLLT